MTYIMRSRVPANPKLKFKHIWVCEEPQMSTCLRLSAERKRLYEEGCIRNLGLRQWRENLVGHDGVCSSGTDTELESLSLVSGGSGEGVLLQEDAEAALLTQALLRQRVELFKHSSVKCCSDQKMDISIFLYRLIGGFSQNFLKVRQHHSSLCRFAESISYSSRGLCVPTARGSYWQLRQDRGPATDCL